MASLIAACSATGTLVFVSDDLDAQLEAGQRGLGVVLTYGILARQVAEDKVSSEPRRSGSKSDLALCGAPSGSSASEAMTTELGEKPGIEFGLSNEEPYRVQRVVSS